MTRFLTGLVVASLAIGCRSESPPVPRPRPHFTDPVPWLEALVRREERAHPGEWVRFVAETADGWVQRQTRATGAPRTVLVTLTPLTETMMEIDEDWLDAAPFGSCGMVGPPAYELRNGELRQFLGE